MIIKMRCIYCFMNANQYNSILKRLKSITQDRDINCCIALYCIIVCANVVMDAVVDIGIAMNAGYVVSVHVF